MSVKRKLKDIAGAVQQRQLVIINGPFVSPQKRCDRCVEPSGMITPDEAAAVCGVSTRTIYRWLETGSIHFSESGDGALLICLLSMAATATLEATETREGYPSSGSIR
jgi:excisionase family DNA binding protein